MTSYSLSPFGRRPALLLCLALAALVGLRPAAAEVDKAETNPLREIVAGADLPSLSELDALIETAQSASGIDEAAKNTLIELYRRTRANLESMRANQARAAEFTQQLETAPAEIESMQKELADAAAAPSKPAEAEVQGLPAETVARRLSEVQTEALIQETRISELDDLLDGAQARPAQARTRITELKQTTDQVDAELAAPPSQGQTAEATQANAWVLTSKRLAALAEIQAVERELASLDVRRELYRSRRDLAERALNQLRAERTALEERQATLRREEAERAQQQADKAQQEAAGKHPLIEQAALENAEITRALSEAAAGQERMNATASALERERERLDADYRGARARIEAAGLNRALGQVLVDRRAAMPDLRALRKQINAREDAIAEATLRQIRFREERRRLQDVDSAVDTLTEADPNARDPQVRDALRDLINQRKALLGDALTADDALIRKLTEVNQSAYRLLDVANGFLGFLDKHLLWVRSTMPMGIENLSLIPTSAAQLLSASGWSEVLRSLLFELKHSPLLWFSLTLVALLLWNASRLKRAIRATAEPLRRIRTDNFRYTVDALALTLIAALPLSLLMWSLGHELANSLESAVFSQAVGKALNEVAFGLYFMRAFQVLVTPGGLADRHFRWSSETLSMIRRNLRWFIFFITPVAVAAYATYYLNDPAAGASLGRLLAIAAMLSTAVVLGRLLHPNTGAFRETLAEHPQGWPNRLRKLWYPLILATPLGLIVLTLIGYQYTAGTLFRSLVATAWLALALIVVQQMIVRWLIVTRRKLALQAALDRQVARRASAERAEAGAGDSLTLLQVEEQQVDLATLDEQTRRLINALMGFGATIGIWLIWAEMLPAFNVLEQVPLWHYQGVVDGTSQLVPVTVADVALVALIVFIATAAARNLPALLEIVLLQMSSVSAGSRYTIRTLVSYVITAVAFLAAFSTLGLSWSQVQWLVAALGVGIGFGLQEIVANFISGLIILFERPVRVGDVVTIGETTGVVTNIQIRATTIRNWDKQELLVPNKEFITGRLLNWTLSDQLNRVTITVGIAYGSDIDRALAALRAVATENPRVLDDPEPTVTIEAFADNAITAVLRCHLDSLEFRLSVTSELYQAIAKRFATDGIEIAFPQRDVHLKASEPLEVRLHRSIDPARPQTGS
jgi:potassium efflux system protein